MPRRWRLSLMLKDGMQDPKCIFIPCFCCWGWIISTVKPRCPGSRWYGYLAVPYEMLWIQKISQQNLTCYPGSLVVPDRFFRFWSSGIARCDCRVDSQVQIKSIGSISTGSPISHMYAKYRNTTRPIFASNLVQQFLITAHHHSASVSCPRKVLVKHRLSLDYTTDQMIVELVSDTPNAIFCGLWGRWWFSPFSTLPATPS